MRYRDDILVIVPSVFTMIVVVDVPLGFALGVQMPPASPVNLNHLIQMMQIQMQRQQAQQAQQQKQMSDILQHLASTHMQHLPAVGSTGTGTAKALDERHFRRILKSDNKLEPWKEWRTRFLTSVRESPPITADVMEKVEVSDSPIRPESVLEADPTFQEALGLQHVLNARLVSTTTGVSFALVKSLEGNGIEA